MSYDSVILADSPTAYRKLGDVTTTAADATGNGNTGTYNATYTQGVTGLVGDGDTATNLTSGFVAVTDPAPGTGDFSWEIWINGAVTNTTVAAIKNSANTNYMATFQNKLSFIGLSSGTLQHPTVMIANTTYHCVFSRIAGVCTLYLNGVASATAGDTSTISTTTNYIGTVGGIDSYLGTVQKEAVYIGANALTQAKVTAHYNAAILTPSGGPIPAPIVAHGARPPQSIM